MPTRCLERLKHRDCLAALVAMWCCCAAKPVHVLSFHLQPILLNSLLVPAALRVVQRIEDEVVRDSAFEERQENANGIATQTAASNEIQRLKTYNSPNLTEADLRYQQERSRDSTRLIRIPQPQSLHN